MEDPEEDPEEDPMEDPEEDPPEDPIEEPVDFPVEILAEDPREAGYVFPTPMTTEVEELTADGIVWRDIHMHPLPAVRSPTPPMLPASPLTSDDDFEELTPDTHEPDPIPFDDPIIPPPPGVSLVTHEWIVSGLQTGITAAEARVDELRMQMTAERNARHTSQGGMRFTNPEDARREMTVIEMRGRAQMRALPTTSDGLVSREDAELIFAGAMSRTRDLTYPAYDV